MTDIVHDELSAGDFDTRIEPLEGSDLAWVLAEDANFLLAVVVTETVNELLRIEPLAAGLLLNRVANADPASKKWDVYLVLISAEIARDVEKREGIDATIRSFRGLRRLVALGVTDSAGVRRALAPFLPLPRVGEDFEANALQALRRELVVNGVEERAAERYIDLFQREGRLNV